MTEPTDTELDAVVCKHWPAFSMQATLVRMWVRAAMRDAIAKWDTPPAEQQAASSAVLKAIREANMQLVRTGDDAFMLVPYKRATAEQQAAPKAAPQQEAREPVSPRHPVVMQWRDNAIEACAKIADAYGHEHAAQDMRAMLTAPQQEAQEPVALHQVYRCKIKSRKQIDKEIPRELQGWWADVAAGQKLLLRQAVQSDLDRCHLGGKRSKDPNDYMCETQTNGSLVSKVALEYMNPEQNVFASTTPQPAPAPLSEREAFETAWEKLYGKRPVLWSQMFASHKMETPAHSEGRYFAASEQAAWKLWQARAALAAQGDTP